MSFNQAQQEAVSHNEGPCLVLAGPGSGKTLTIVGRIQKLIQTYHVSPEEILVITFTKYAAVEMKNRFFFSDEGDSPCCHLRNISWNLLWDFKVGISVRTGEYSVRGRKTADAASDCQQKRD